MLFSHNYVNSYPHNIPKCTCINIIYPYIIPLVFISIVIYMSFMLMDFVVRYAVINGKQ